jgi:hypothetical protein
VAVQFDSNYPSLQVDLVFPSPIGTVDITEYVLAGQTFIGRQRESDRYDASAAFELDNWDGRFTPGQTAGTYSSGGVSFVRPRVGVRVQATWSATTYGLFRGVVTSWQDVWDAEGHDTRSVISCAGLSSILASWIGTAVGAVGADERSGARVSRILTAASASPFGTSIATGNVTLAATDLSGDGMSQVLDVVDAEGSGGAAFWFDGDGVAVFEGRDALVVNTRSNTSQVTFSDGSVFFREAAPTSDDDLIRNRIVMQREGGLEQAVEDAASQTTHGVRSYSRTGLPLQFDGDVLGAAQLNLLRWKDPDFRLAALTIDPAQSPALIWPHALGRKIRDRATVSATPARSGVAVAGDAFIEGIGHTFSQNSWSTTFQLSSADPFDGVSAGVWDSGLWDTASWFF